MPQPEPESRALTATGEGSERRTEVRKSFHPAAGGLPPAVRGEESTQGGQTPMSEKDLETDVQIGDFRILRRLGAGGMGVVYQARQVSLDRLVALKVLGSRLTRPQDITRFRREAQAAAKLHHPGIAGIYFIGQDDKLCYMAMEYIDGLALSDLIDRLRQARHPQPSLDACVRETTTEQRVGAIRFDDPGVTVEHEPAPAGHQLTSLTPEVAGVIAAPAHIRRCCEVIREAALALGYAHGQGVVHRDIKPGNLMLDRQGQVHVIDFGVARFFEDATVTQTGQLVGTPMYMSPEQVTGRLAADRRSDLYALGLVLYELLTLRPPRSWPPHGRTCCARSCPSLCRPSAGATRPSRKTWRASFIRPPPRMRTSGIRRRGSSPRTCRITSTAGR
jgi:serine/threonine protein kinase